MKILQLSKELKVIYDLLHQFAFSDISFEDVDDITEDMSEWEQEQRYNFYLASYYAGDIEKVVNILEKLMHCLGIKKADMKFVDGEDCCYIEDMVNKSYNMLEDLCLRLIKDDELNEVVIPTYFNKLLNEINTIFSHYEWMLDAEWILNGQSMYDKRMFEVSKDTYKRTGDKLDNMFSNGAGKKLYSIRDIVRNTRNKDKSQSNKIGGSQSDTSSNPDQHQLEIDTSQINRESQIESEKEVNNDIA